MIVVKDSPTLIRLIAAAEERIITIDGWHLSGKSWLGRTAAHDVGRTWLDLDDFLKRQEGAFVDHMDLEALRAAVWEGGPIILSGVCMQEVLARIGSPKAVSVYVKRMHLSYWTDEDEAEGRKTKFEELFPLPALEREVRSYHQSWQPHTKAHYVYERTVNANGL